jgi:hypothetical protein
LPRAFLLLEAQQMGDFREGRLWNSKQLAHLRVDFPAPPSRGKAMPRFYFDVREGTKFVSDEDGIEFDSLDAAEDHAAQTAARIGRDNLPSRKVREIVVEVRNEHKQRVITVAVLMRIQRVTPLPEPPDGEGSPPIPWIT